MNEVTIILTETDANRWKQFQQNYDNFMLLINKGVFEIQTGKATLNFLNGELQMIDKQEVIWHK